MPINSIELAMSRANGGARRSCHADEDRVGGSFEFEPSVGTDGADLRVSELETGVDWVLT